MREHLLAEGADRQAGDRDAELHCGDEPRRVARDAPHRARAAVALVLELEDARAARRDEAVLGRDEERVQEDEAREGDKLEREGHAPAWAVLGASSSSKRISPMVTDPSARPPPNTNVRSILEVDADGVPRGALQVGPQPRAGHAVQLVVEPVHGLRPPVHLLLRTGLR